MTITYSFLRVLFHNPGLYSDMHLTEEHFPAGNERDLFTAMKEIYQNGGTVDEPALVAKGFTYTELMELGHDYETIASNWRFREKEIITLYNRRKLRELAEKIAHDTDSSPTDIMDLWQAETSAMENVSGFEIRTLGSIVNESHKAILERASIGGSLVGIKSGLPQLDSATLGFQKRNLYYIGGRPAQGKTALLLNFMLRCNVPCGMLSAESGGTEVTDRLLSIDSGIDTQKLAAGILTLHDQDVLFSSASKVYEKKTVVYDESNMSIDRACMVARQMVRRHGIQILFIDYLQILKASTSMQNRPMREQVIYASKQLKQLARSLDIPVVCAAQLNRSSDDGRPRLAQFSESAQIEQDADVAILIWNKTPTESYLLVEKNRNGRSGDIPVTFNRSCLRFM